MGRLRDGIKLVVSARGRVPPSLKQLRTTKPCTAMKMTSQSNLPKMSYERVLVAMPCTLKASRFLVVLAATKICFGLTFSVLSSPLTMDSAMRPAPMKPKRAPEMSATVERLPDLLRLGLASEAVEEERRLELFDLVGFTSDLVFDLAASMSLFTFDLVADFVASTPLCTFDLVADWSLDFRLGRLGHFHRALGLVLAGLALLLVDSAFDIRRSAILGFA